ncbi:MAG: tRNA(Ile)-lysidine synthetase-like protein, partial [Candidatus Azotimanducaceae bacterium]
MISDSSRQLIAGADRCVLALSGGVDSVVLLDLLTRLQPASLIAIHVDHQLFPESSAVAAFCIELAGRYGIPVNVEQVTVSSAGSQEARAREARYAGFGRLLKAGDLLLQAHHADDQVETILLDVFRGGRHHGLRGMPASRKLGEAQLHRPLLDVTRSDIVQYAAEHDLKWCEDPSNRDETIDRNYLRHTVLPLIKERFPGAASALLQGAIRDGRLQTQRLNENAVSLQANGGMPDNLALPNLRQWDAQVIKDKLDAWLIGLSLPLLTRGCSNELTQRVLAGSLIDITVGKLMFREHQSRLYVLRCLPENESGALLLREDDVQLSGGILDNSLVKGSGLPADIEYKVVTRRGG